MRCEWKLKLIEIKLSIYFNAININILYAKLIKRDGFI